MKTTTLITLSLLTFNCFAIDATSPIIKIDFEITKGDYDKIKEKIKHTSLIILNSPGGDSEEAIRISEIIKSTKSSVIVSGICASSCANYLFLAGNYKIITKNSTLAWHGSPSKGCEHTTDEIGKKLTAQDLVNFKNYLNYSHSINELFFNSLKISNKITCLNKEILSYYDKKNPKNNFRAFTMNSESMHYFGVENLIDLRDKMVNDDLKEFISYIEKSDIEKFVKK